MKERFKIKWKDKGFYDWTTGYFMVGIFFVGINFIALASGFSENYLYAKDSIIAIGCSWLMIFVFILIHLIASSLHGNFYLERITYRKEKTHHD